MIPVSIKQLNECEDDKIIVANVKASVITIVGLVKSVDYTSVKISFHVDDQTGDIEAINYVVTDDGEERSPDIHHLPTKNTYGRIVGALKSLKGRKYVVVFKYFPVTDMNEVTCHMLEVILIPIKLKKLQEAEEVRKTVKGLNQDCRISDTTADDLLMANIMDVMEGPNWGGGGTGPGNVCMFKTNQQLVLSVLQNCPSETGLHLDEIVQNLTNTLSKKEIKDIIEELSKEGHVYSTIDDDHYKNTA